MTGFRRNQWIKACLWGWSVGFVATLATLIATGVVR